MRNCRREGATRGNLDGAEGGISYSLLYEGAGLLQIIPQNTRMYFGAVQIETI